MAQPQIDYRIRRDRLDAEGGVTLRHLSRVRHFHISYKRRGQPVMLLVAGDHVRVLTKDGALLRELTLDPSRDYQRSTAPTLVRHQVDGGPLLPETDIGSGPSIRTLNLAVKRSLRAA